MDNSNFKLPAGLNMRPARDADNAFIASLFNANRDDLRSIDAESDFIEQLIDMQRHAQTQGYGETFPNAMYFIIEKHNERVGRVVIDFGADEIRIVDIAIIPAAHGQGFGKGVIQALQIAAKQACSPLTLSVYKTNLSAYQLYHSLGFKLVDSTPLIDFLAWEPQVEKSKIFTS